MAREIARTDDDEILESLIDTFPASDSLAWAALARVGIPKRKFDIAAGSKTTTSLIEPVSHPHL